MASPFPLALFGISAILASTVFADYVKTKSGETFQGKITRETDTQVVMEVTVAAGITDEKTFAKEDVEKAFKVTPETQAFEALKAYAVGAYSFQPAAYVAMEKPLETFLKDYPQSEYKAEAQGMLDALKAEEERVVAGNLKWEGKWYTPEEAKKNQYQLGAAMRYGQMKAQLARRDFIGALNSFDQIEKTYPASKVFPEALEAALTTITATTAEADRLEAVGKLQKADFDKNIPFVNEPQKSQMIQAWKGQVATAENALAAAMAAKPEIKWKPLLPLAPKSFEEFKKTAATEKTRLEKLPLSAMRSSVAATDEAEDLLKQHLQGDASAKLKEAVKLWPTNERAKALMGNAQSAAPAPAAPAASAAASAKASATPEATTSSEEAPTATPAPSPAGKVKRWGLF